MTGLYPQPKYMDLLIVGARIDDNGMMLQLKNNDLSITPVTITDRQLFDELYRQLSIWYFGYQITDLESPNHLINK